MSLSLQEIETEVLNLPETEQLRLIDFFESLKIKITKQTQINFNSLHNKTVMSTEGERVLAILKETGFLGSMPDVPELSENYKDYLADASLVLLAEELGHGRIVSTDKRDFHTYRWKNHKPFNNLLEVFNQ